MSDLHIERILSKRQDILEKSFFILRAKSIEDEELVYRVSEYGTIYSDGLEKFSTLVPTYVKSSRSDKEPTFIGSFDAISPTGITAAQASEQVHFFGRHGVDLSEQNRSGGERFLVRRAVQKDIVERLQQGTRFHLVHSEMGDGKTLLAEMIAADLAAAGWKVLIVQERLRSISGLITYARAAPEKSILIFTETEITLRQLGELSDACSDKEINLLYCCRSPYLDLSHEERINLEKRFDIWKIPILSSHEFGELNSIYNQFGLWGDMQGRSLKDKQRYILSDCQGEFRSIAIGHLHQARLVENLSREIHEMEEIDSSLTRTLGIAMLIAFFGKRTKVFVINKFISKKSFDISSREFVYGKFNLVYIKNGEYFVPSAIYSREILRQFFKTDLIIDIIEDIFVKSSQFGYHEFSDIRRELMQFGNLQRLILKNGSSPDIDRIVEIYRNFSDTGIEADNIHFWQQYSIAFFANGEYKLAQRRLDTAFGLARAKPFFDPYMLEHHQARLLMVSRSKAPNDYNDHEDAYTNAFEIAARLIQDPSRALERDTLYLMENFSEIFSGVSLTRIKNSLRVSHALKTLKAAVAERRPNSGVGPAILKATMRHIDDSLKKMS